VATALEGEARVFYDLHIVRRSLVPVRYALSTLRTLAYLLTRRPRALIVTNPPIFPGLIGLAYGAATGAPLVLDSHPSAFGNAPLSGKLSSVHAWLARRAVTTLVTVPALVDVVRSWGAQADIVHEAPPDWSVAPASRPAGRPQVLFIGRFAGDEPTAALINAARLVPDVDVCITGDVRKCPGELRDTAPPNVIFTGFLRGPDYPNALEKADVILVLTNHPLAVNRSAYEGVFAGRPLVISALPALTALFPFAIPVSNDAAGIAKGIRTAVERHAELISAAPRARALQDQRWREQLEVLRRRLRGVSSPGGSATRRRASHRAEGAARRRVDDRLMRPQHMPSPHAGVDATLQGK
jgi:glycosyltransferase involved in cell wall biosynthesis